MKSFFLWLFPLIFIGIASCSNNVGSFGWSEITETHDVSFLVRRKYSSASLVRYAQLSQTGSGTASLALFWYYTVGSTRAEHELAATYLRKAASQGNQKASELISNGYIQKHLQN